MHRSPTADRDPIQLGQPVEAAGVAQKIGAIVHRTMVDTINVPPGDNFQLITEYDRGHLVYDPTYLAISRTDGVVIIQITLNEGRTVELKKVILPDAGRAPALRSGSSDGGRAH